MKNYLLLFIPLLILVNSCSTYQTKVSEASMDEANILKPLGEQISKDLIVSLQDELKKAIKSGGITEAIAVCNLKALPITDIISKSTDNKVEIKRTSFKYRNKKNAPDKYEEIALKYYHSKIENNENPPEFYIQKIKNNDKTDFYYYKPLKVGAVCLNCHGTNELIAPQTQSILQEYYPEDKAMGYKKGDFRGLIRIKFPDFH